MSSKGVFESIVATVAVYLISFSSIFLPGLAIVLPSPLHVGLPVLVISCGIIATAWARQMKQIQQDRTFVLTNFVCWMCSALQILLYHLYLPLGDALFFVAIAFVQFSMLIVHNLLCRDPDDNLGAITYWYKMTVGAAESESNAEVLSLKT